MQIDVNGSSHDYLLDTGEIQNALNLWGTVHYTGYPFYTILSTLLTQVLLGFAQTPAAAASGTSLIWSILGLLFYYRFLCYITPGNRILPAFTILALGLVEAFWIHSVAAEVYSFSQLLVSLSLLLGMRLQRQWQSIEWLILVCVLGTAVAHHRLLVLLLPMIAVLDWPSWWHWLKKSSRNFIVIVTVFLIPFLAYLYLPLRARQGAPWVYGQPGTWPGFWQQFTGSEVTGGLLRLPDTLEEWQGNVSLLTGYMTEQLPWVVVVLGLTGLVWLTRRQARTALALMLGALLFPFFSYLFPKAVWVPAVLMPSVMCLFTGVAYLLHMLSHSKPFLQMASWAGMLLLAAFLFFSNLEFVNQLVNDPAGRDIIAQLKAIPTGEQAPEEKPVVALPWGTGYFAANYGHRVTRELPGIELVDHRANLDALLASEGSILTPSQYLTYWPPSWWMEKLGEVNFYMVAPGIVAVSRGHPYQEVPLDVDFDLENGVRIRSFELADPSENNVSLDIYWEAMRPITQSYSVAVHLLSQNPPAGPDHIVAQADAVHPVQGWYPTSVWSVGEIVHDIYELEIPDGESVTAVRITMYTVDDEGQFKNGPWFSVDLIE